MQDEKYTYSLPNICFLPCGCHQQASGTIPDGYLVTLLGRLGRVQFHFKLSFLALT